MCASAPANDRRAGAIALSLAQQGPVSISLLRERTGLDRQEARSVLRRLVDRGALVQLGAKRGTALALRADGQDADAAVAVLCEVLAGLRDRHGDAVVEAFFLDGEAFRARYAELAGIDYWA